MILLKLKTFILISLSSFVIFTLVVRFSWAVDTPISEKAAAGKAVWQSYNCVSCHTLFGNGGYVGGDLTHILTRRSPQGLVDFFTEPPLVPPSLKKRHLHLTEEEAEDLIAYFEYLNTIPTLGWPPVPRESKGGGVP